jgi:preprotein translocase subunit SecY
MNAILTKITVVGGIYLSILCLIPDIMIAGIKLQHLPLIGAWIMRHYEGFTPRSGRIRGRRSTF